jgi:hypothetical protein
MGYATFYAFLKQRQEYGCTGSLFSLNRQCIDENSVFFKDIKAQDTDTVRNLSKKVSSVLSYHEKAAVWRICLIMAAIFTMIVFGLFPNGKHGDYISIHLFFFAALYFYFNFINFHHFRRLKVVGDSLLQDMLDKCNK